MALRQAKSYSIDMCSGPILPKMLRFAVPLMFSSMLQLLFNAADVIVVGRFAGDNSLAAVGSTTALINLLTNLFLGLSIGANILAARHYGAREDEELSKTVHTAMLLSILSGVLLTVAGVLGARQILTWMQSPPEVLKLSALYLRIYFLGMTATMLYNFGAALLRAVGDTRRPLFYLSGAGVINVVLNLLFVIVLKMDVAGVALATVISQCISAFLVVRCLIKESGAIRLDLRRLKLHPTKLRQILRVGLPAGFQGILFSLSNVVIQSSVNSFGEIVVAGGSAASSVENFVYVAMRPMSPSPAKTWAPATTAASGGCWHWPSAASLRWAFCWAAAWCISAPACCGCTPTPPPSSTVPCSGCTSCACPTPSAASWTWPWAPCGASAIPCCP